jgi:hypothetical protein
MSQAIFSGSSAYAAHAAPTLEAIAEFGGASAIGSIAAWLASTVHARVTGRA